MGKGQSFRSGFVMFCLVLAVGMAGVHPAWAAATRVVLTGPTTVLKDGLGAFTLTTQNSDGDVDAVTEDTVFNLTSTTSGTDTFYSDAAGTTSITQKTIANGQSTATVYYRDNSFGLPMLTASVDSGQALTHANKQIMVKANNALSFDGTDDYIVTDTAPELNMGGSSFTVELWVRGDSSLDFTTERMLVEYGNDYDVTGQYTITSGNATSLWFGFNGGDHIEANMDWTDGKWHHVAGVLDSDADKMRLYVDGVLKTEVAKATTPGNANQSLYIGSRGGTDLFSDVDMDEIRIWNTARTQAEIRANMHRELQGNEPGLKGYYKLDTGTGTTAFDSCSGGNHGTLTDGPTWQTSGAMSGPGNALDFEKDSDQYVDCANDTSLQVTGSRIALEAWINPESFFAASSAANSIIDKSNNTAQGYVLRCGGNGVLGFAFGDGSSWHGLTSPENALTIGKWQHVAAVYNGTAMTLYVNGVAVATQATSANITNAAMNMRIGGSQQNADRLFDGMIDEVRIWNTSRSAAQIRDNMAKSLQGDEPGLVAYYRMDQQAVAGQTTLYDQTRNGNDGTLTNMDATTDWVASTAFNTWIGSESTDWATATNWSRCAAPVATDNVGIPDYSDAFGYPAGNAPTISGDSTVNHFVLATDAGSTLDSNLTVDGNLLLNADLGVGANTVTVTGTTANTGTLSISTGTLDCNDPYDATGGSTTFTGAGHLKLASTHNLGDFTEGTGTVTFDGASAQTITGTFTPYNLTIDNAAGVSAATATSLAVDNQLTVTSGAFTSASDYHHVSIGAGATLALSGYITVSGDWSNSGTLTHDNHKVTLDGAGQSISGTTTFYDLAKTVASAATLTFEDGSTTTITNTLLLQGASGQLLSLRSSTDGDQWKIDPQGTRTIEYLDVKDSNNICGTNLAAEDYECVDSGNNNNWFNYAAPTVTTQAVSNIGMTTATGNGNITSLGYPNPTAHGVCWSTTANPTVDDSKDDKGAASATGAFTGNITGLSAGATYYVRAFATNTVDTSYGEQVEFKTKVALTMGVSPVGGGTVTPAAGSTSNVDADVAQNITAAAGGAYHFVNWTANPAGNANFGNASSASTTVTLTGSATVTANFAINTYALTTAANPAAGGAVIRNPDKSTYDHGENVQLTATANANYVFTGWSGSATGTENPITVAMTGNKTVTASFEPTYTVTYNGNGNTGGSAPTDGNAYQEGAQVTALGASTLVKTGYAFASWNTAADGSGTSYAPGNKFNMPGANVTLYAQWTGGTFTLTVTSGTGSGTYDVGAVVSIAANPPAEGKVFDQWTGDVAHVANANLANTTVTMPEANISITATYKDKPAEKFTLTVTSGTGSAEYEAGMVVGIAASPPAEGKIFDAWTGQTATVSNINDPNTTLTMPNAGVSISAAYKDKPAEKFALTVNSGTGSGSYPAGQVVSISADPAPSGQIFDKWTGQTVTVANINTPNTSITMPDSQVVIKAVYKAEPATTYTLTVQSGTGSGEYKAGRTVTIAATPAATGLIFDKWTGQTANVANVNIPNTTITMPESDVSVTATYKTDPDKDYTLEVRTDTWEAMDRDMSNAFSSSVVESVPAGMLVNLMAPDPPSGYVFDIWSGQTANVANVNLPETTIYMPDTNVIVTATYKPEQNPVTLTVTNGTGSGVYDPNTVVDITADDPPAGQMFDKWTGQTGNVENINLADTRIVMPSTDASIQAVYRDKPETLYELSVTSGTGSGEYRAGVMVEIAATTAPEGFMFDKWVGQIATLENINSANTRVYMPPNEVSVTATFTVSPQALATGKASSFTVTVSGIEMFNGSAWVPLFAGTAQLDLIAGGTFPGVADLNLPQGTYTKLRITFRNAFSTSGTLRYDGTRYYTTAATFGGQTNLASVPTTVQGSMAAYIFRMAAWGALNANVVKEFNITPITVTEETDYQPTLRFTLSNRLRLMGVSGSPGTYYFEHAEPGVSVVE